MAKNVLHYGDNLEILATMEKESEDLIYIDPPFFIRAGVQLVCTRGIIQLNRLDEY